MSLPGVHRWRSRIIWAGCLLGFCVVGARLGQLHVKESARFEAQALSVRERVIPLEAKRGNVYDRNGDLLATTRTRIQLGIDPSVFSEENMGKLVQVAGIIGEDWPTVREKALTRTFRTGEGEEKVRRWALLGEISEEEYAGIQKLGIRGLYGISRHERFYPGGELAAHLLGFLNKEGTAVNGVEQRFNFYLEGHPGWIETEVDGRRRELAVHRRRQVEPQNGDHLELTLDLRLQAYVESALREACTEMNPLGASVIVSDPQTGELLAMANWPTYDPNEFWKYPIGNYINRAVNTIYEPGSTFKIIPVAAALEEGLVHRNSRFDCDREHIRIQGTVVELPTDHKPLGEVPVWKIIQKSSNRGAAQIGVLLGQQRLESYVDKFNFGSRTGWELGPEENGLLVRGRNWKPSTLTREPIGYSIGVTPLQMHLAMATVANGGEWQPLQVVRRAFADTGETLLDFSDGLGKRRILRQDVASEMALMLEKVVSVEGTAGRAAIPEYRVGGKTGTSRMLKNGVYQTDAHYSSFSGFFPVNDPKVVITVVFEGAEVEGIAYGGVVAAPLFRKIADRAIGILEIRRPDKEEPLFALGGEG